MTIRRGEPWGARTARPDGLRVAADDADLARLLSADPAAPAAVAAGDLLRTLGGGSGAGRGDALAVPVDTIELRLDGGAPRTVVAHVVMRSRRMHGGFLWGPVVFVMNAEFYGHWHVAPRGHPNDGRVEVVSCGPELGARQRLGARRRLRTGTHVPHPAIASRSVGEASWRFDRPLVVIADGVVLGRARAVEVAVRPDAATLWV